MTVKELLTHELDSLTEDEMRQVVEYVSFLKFHARLNPLPHLDESELAKLYAEFAEEEQELAEQGMADYVEGLTREDAR